MTDKSLANYLASGTGCLSALTTSEINVLVHVLLYYMAKTLT